MSDSRLRFFLEGFFGLAGLSGDTEDDDGLAGFVLPLDANISSISERGMGVSMVVVDHDGFPGLACFGSASEAGNSGRGCSGSCVFCVEQADDRCR